MNDYEALFKAVAFFSFKYGKIDWIESHNEWWLLSDSKLRKDFNITTGIQYPDVMRYKAKSVMKQYFKDAGIPVARHHLIIEKYDCLEFIKEVGYPVFVKPNIGVGSNYSYKIDDEASLDVFLAKPRNEVYIMEEFIEGTTVSYDGIADSNSNVAFESSNVFPMPNYLVVNNHGDDLYYTDPYVPSDLSDYGRRVIKSFGVKHRIFHLEFFRLGRDYPHLGKKGELVALEVNMRPAGGYTPEMISVASGISIYDAWAKVIATDNLALNATYDKFYVGAPARRNEGKYRHTHEEILNSFSSSIFMHGKYPPIIADGMGDYFYMAKFKQEADIYRFFDFVLERIA